MRPSALLPRALSAVFAVLLIVVAALPARAVEVQQVTSPGGIEAWLVEDHSNPILSLEMAFVGGAAFDPDDRLGLAHLASGLLDEGAGELDSQTFQGRLADLSIRLYFDAGLDSFQGTLRTLSENRDEAFELLRLSLSEPRFDEEPLERVRNQVLVQLRRESEDPGTIANRALREIMFPDHPYGRPVHGTLESIQAITADDLRQFVAQRLARDVLRIAVVGDITPAELGPLLDQAFLGLPAEAVGKELPEAVPQALGQVVVIERDIPQSVMSFGHAGVMRDDPDFYAAYVANRVFGGGSFSSRLYEEVREKRGLAYGVGSYLYPLEKAGLLVGYVATQNERADETLEVLRHEWARIAEEGPSEAEVTDAKTYITGSYPLRFSSTGNIAGMLLGIQLDDLGIDYVNIRNDLIDQVTLEDARRIARELYRPEDLTVVIVGKPAGVASQEAEAGEAG